MSGLMRMTLTDFSSRSGIASSLDEKVKFMPGGPRRLLGRSLDIAKWVLAFVPRALSQEQLIEVFLAMPGYVRRSITRLPIAT
jgi:hypothetical protein